MNRARLGLLLIILAILAGVFWRSTKPPPPAAEMTVQFVGRTNRLGAGREAVIKLSNRGNVVLTVFQGIEIEYRGRPYRGGLSTTAIGDHSGAIMTVLAPGQSVTVQFQQPVVGQPWRALFRFAPGDLSESGRWDQLKADLFRRLQLIGMVRSREIPHIRAGSSWIDWEVPAGRLGPNPLLKTNFL